MRTLDIVLVSIAICGAVFVIGFVISRAQPPGSRLAAFNTDRLPSRGEELEFADRLQMLEALNEHRRRKGLPELGEDELESVTEDDLPPGGLPPSRR